MVMLPPFKDTFKKLHIPLWLTSYWPETSHNDHTQLQGRLGNNLFIFNIPVSS